MRRLRNLAAIPKGSWVSMGVVLLAALAFVLSGFPNAALGPGPGTALVVAQSGPVTGNCGPSNPSPAALSIPGTAPSKTLKATDVLNVSLEFKVLNFSKKDNGMPVYIPSLTVVFPLSPSGVLDLYGVPKTLKISGSAWTSATSDLVSYHLSAATTFSTTGTPYLSTAKSAVMATASSGNLTLEFRWRWTYFNPSTQVTHLGVWTVPSSTSTGSFLPSIFYPAPYVGLVSNSTSPALSGTNFTLQLNGSVSSTFFRVVLEYPNNGTEIQSIIENTTAGITLFNATVPLTFRNGTDVPAAHYLIHIHDHCEAIVRMLGIVVTAGGAGPAAVRGAETSTMVRP
jgi:hypothetical protein